ncbi:MAG: hypothetical protein ACYDA0_04725 [Candidatus Dormibacteraceae bacterium]
MVLITRKKQHTDDQVGGQAQDADRHEVFEPKQRSRPGLLREFAEEFEPHQNGCGNERERQVASDDSEVFRERCQARKHSHGAEQLVVLADELFERRPGGLRSAVLTQGL